MKPLDDRPQGDDADDVAPDPAAANLPLDEPQVQKLADDALVHALLVGRFQDTPEATSHRVEQACRAFEKAFRIRQHWIRGLSTAAAAALLLGFVFLGLPAPRAQARLKQVLDAFDVGDKTYQIDIGLDIETPVSDLGRRSRLALRRPTFRSAAGTMPTNRLDGALLYVRARQHVLAYTLPTGLKVTRGFDGQRGWMIHPWRGLPTGSDPNLLRTEIPDEALSLLFVDLRDILHQIRKNYRLSEPRRAVSSNGRPPVLYLVADRASPRRRLPRRIELWVNAQTGQLHDILCSGMSFPKSAPRYVVRLSLVRTEPLSSDWFTARAHLADAQTP